MNADQLFTEKLKVRGETSRDPSAPKQTLLSHNSTGETDWTRRTTGGKTGLTSDQDQTDVMNMQYSHLIGQKQQFCLIHTVSIKI